MQDEFSVFENPTHETRTVLHGKIIQEPESFDDIGAVREWQRQIDEQDREWRKIAQSISNEEFPSDYHMFIIDKGEQGKMEIELDTYGQGISVSYSGDKKSWTPL